MNAHQAVGHLKFDIASLLREYPELAEDETLRADMIEAETDLEKVVAMALSELREAETMAASIKEREAELAGRRARFDRKVEAMRKLMLSVMEAGGLPKLVLPEATITVREPSAKVEITNVEDLPQGYFRLTRTADKTAIKTALMSGEAIPGAQLALGDGSITIRTK